MEPDCTDNVIWVLLVENPDMYTRALKYVFPFDSASPGAEAEQRLAWFIRDNIDEFNKLAKGPHIDDKRINFCKLFSELFL